MGKKTVNVILIGIVIFLLSGCVETEILDELTIIQGIGFDLGEGGKIIGSANNPVYQKDGPPINHTITGEAKLKKSILQVLHETQPNPMAMGSLEVILFGEKLATEKGILDLMDAFQRDPAIGATIQLGMVEGEAKEFIAGDYGVRGNAYFINQVIETNIKTGNLPETNFHRFLASFHEVGKTPYIPILKKKEKEVKLTGVGFFRYGKIVHRIPMRDAFYLKLLTDHANGGWQDVEIDDGMAAIENIGSKRKYHLTNASPPYEVTIDIQMSGVINEFTGQKITPEILEKLERKLEAQITTECEKMVEKFKEIEIDPIGFGSFVRSKDRNFDYAKWQEENYQNMQVNVKAKVEIGELGTIE